MEKWLVVGYRKVDFKDGEKQIKGVSLFLERDPENDNVEGTEVCKLFIPERIDYYPMLGETVCIGYNKYGKVSTVQVV